MYRKPIKLLAPREYEVLIATRRCVDNDVPPSCYRLSSMLKLSKQHIHQLLMALWEKGWIVMYPDNSHHTPFQRQFIEITAPDSMIRRDRAIRKSLRGKTYSKKDFRFTHSIRKAREYERKKKALSNGGNITSSPSRRGLRRGRRVISRVALKVQATKEKRKRARETQSLAQSEYF